MYARFLHLDEKAILDDYRLEKSSAEPFNRDEQPFEFDLRSFPFFNKDQSRFLVKIGAGLLSLFIVVKIFGLVFHKKEPRPIVKKAATVKQVSKSQEQTLNPSAKKAERVMKVQLQEPVKKEVAPAAVAVAKEPQPIEQKISIPSDQNLSKGITLAVKPRINSWIQVKVDGVVVFQSTLKKGVPESWTAKEKIELSGKDIDNLDYEVNGKMIGELGRADRQARRLIVTKDGLTVKK